MKIILRVLIALAVALLFASANASMGPAQEKVNSDVAKDLNAATQSDKTTRDLDQKAIFDTLTALSSRTSNIDERHNLIDQRLAQLEKKIEEKESVTHWFRGAIEKVIADAVGFAVFAIIVVFSLSRSAAPMECGKYGGKTTTPLNI